MRSRGWSHAIVGGGQASRNADGLSKLEKRRHRKREDRGKEKILPWGSQKGYSLANTLVLAPYDPFSDSDLQNCELINLWYSKSPRV